MELLKILCIINLLVLIFVLIKLSNIKLLIIKNKLTNMATLAEFQQVATDINTAATNIITHIGTGMSIADQDTALQTLRDAVTNLNAAIPAQ